MSDFPGPPAPGEYAPYYAKYVSLAPAGDLLAHLAEQGRATAQALSALPTAQAGHRYAPGKWSVVEVLGHVVDCERVFAYRALRVARGDETPLPGFDQDSYVAAGGFDLRPLAEVVEEFESVRHATLTLFRSLSAEAWARRGTANALPVTVRALAHIVAGHELHHLGVLRDKYGSPASAG